VTASAGEGRFRGEPAVTLRAGDLSATFLPGLGMTGVSLRAGRREHLALPGGLDALRAGATLGLPLLAPWANRLGAWCYRAANVTVDLDGLALRTDDHGLPIHGLLVGRPGWRVDRLAARGEAARLTASIAVDGPAFPFPHRLAVTAALRPPGLTVTTALTPTARRRVPVAFGWHPYLRLPGSPRGRWELTLPARDHVALDPRGIPTGVEAPARAESAPIGRRTFDDLYRLPARGRALSLQADDGGSLTLNPGRGYAYAQVWVPPGRPFAALEPMTTPTNALATGATPLIAPGDTYTAEFTLAVGVGRAA
jgi:aldose 1-epimerase